MSESGSFSWSLSCCHNPSSRFSVTTATSKSERRCWRVQELPFPVSSESLEGCRCYLRANSEGNRRSALGHTFSITVPHHERHFLFSGLWLKGGDCAAVFNAQHALFSLNYPGYELYPGFDYVWIFLKNIFIISVLFLLQLLIILFHHVFILHYQKKKNVGAGSQIQFQR